MVVASYVSPKDEKRYARRKLSDARAVIKSLPLLRSIANDFKPLAHLLVRNNQNSLFQIAASSTPKNQLLVDLEYALRHFRFKLWGKDAQERFFRTIGEPQR